MKRKISTLLMAGTLLLTTSCIGSFSLTNTIYQWNNTVGEKFVNALVFAGLVIIPVYEVTLFVDGIVINTIEFWSGSNPIAANEDLNESQIVSANGKTYKITAKRNKFIAEQIEGEGKGEKAELVFHPEENSWYLNHNGTSTKIVNVEDDVVTVFGKNSLPQVYSLNDVMEYQHNGLAMQ